MSKPGFGLFDADNHYYEAEDAFTRHMDARMKKRAIQWATVDGRQRLMVAGRINRFIPNPTFDPVAKPGCLDEYFRARNPEGKDLRTLFGDLEPIRPEYRDRDARLALMDAQGIDGCFMFPTLGVGMEEALTHDPEAATAAFSAFNRWLQDDWGFNYRDRIFSAPYISLLDPDAAVAELEASLKLDARVVVLRSAPVEHPDGPRSLGDPRHDPFWARVNESGITVAFHSGDSGYHRFADAWGEGGDMQAFAFSPLRSLLSASPIHDTIAALVAHGVFARHRRLRVATIESGSEWVGPLTKKLKKAYGQHPNAFAEDPIETLRRHVWVSPYYEDDLRELSRQIGAGHMLFGSDYPHAEGLAEPWTFVRDLDGFSADDQRLIMRDNGMRLVQPAA